MLVILKLCDVCVFVMFVMFVCLCACDGCDDWLVVAMVVLVGAIVVLVA